MTQPPPMPAQRPRGGQANPAGPPGALVMPRFAGPDTFARLPRPGDVGAAAGAVPGIPFGSGVSCRPGARFGPAAGLDGAQVVEVAPAYDHAELTALAAANVVYELLGLLALTAGGAPPVPSGPPTAARRPEAGHA